MREDLIDVHTMLNAKCCALGLADRVECPGPYERQLAAQQVAAHVNGDVFALANESGRPPGTG